MKILIADDHQLYQDALSILVQRLDEPTEIHLSSSYTELLQLAAASDNWGLMLVDLNMPGLSYYEGIAQLSTQHPDTPIIVITSSDDPEDSQRALQAGAQGYMSKAMKSDDMLNAIKLMLSSGISIHPNYTVPTESTISELTPRQQDVLELLCQGESNKRIALNLELSEHTVKLHVRAILQALNAENRTQAVIIAKQHSLQK
ncbi:response regulator transcription factor [Pseudomonadota bacterium]|nr:response regulator transcription factor [Pseudomonadota bacterium]